MDDRLCMVTGAAGGMGRVIAREVACRGMRVIVVCRAADQAAALQRDLVEETGNTEIFAMSADLGDFQSVRRLASEFVGQFRRLDVLVNNAGAHFLTRSDSKDGHEMHLAINHLGPFLLTRLLVDALAAATPARIVNVSSASILDTRTLPIGKARPVELSLENIEAQCDFAPMVAYAHSKMLNLMCGYVLARKLAPYDVAVHALHPGIVATDIIADIAPPLVQPFLGLVRRSLRSPEQGAAGTIALATEEGIVPATGGYFVDGRPLRTPAISYDLEQQDAVWGLSCSMVGVDPERLFS
jgi:NAD(P)-dependent dehydrogenase (short-subunit alcohol dehydrogenase family)